MVGEGTVIDTWKHRQISYLTYQTVKYNFLKDDLNIVTKLFDISNVFKRKLHYHKLLKEVSMNNLRQVSTVKFTELKVNR